MAAQARISIEKGEIIKSSLRLEVGGALLGAHIMINRRRAVYVVVKAVAMRSIIIKMGLKKDKKADSIIRSLE